MSISKAQVVRNFFRSLAGSDAHALINNMVGAALTSPNKVMVDAAAFSLARSCEDDFVHIGILSLDHTARRFGQADGRAVEMLWERLEGAGLLGSMDDLLGQLSMIGVHLPGLEFALRCSMNVSQMGQELSKGQVRQAELDFREDQEADGGEWPWPPTSLVILDRAGVRRLCFVSRVSEPGEQFSMRVEVLLARGVTQMVWVREKEEIFGLPALIEYDQWQVMVLNPVTIPDTWCSHMTPLPPTWGEPEFNEGDLRIVSGMNGDVRNQFLQDLAGASKGELANVMKSAAENHPNWPAVLAASLCLTHAADPDDVCAGITSLRRIAPRMRLVDDEILRMVQERLDHDYATYPELEYLVG